MVGRLGRLGGVMAREEGNAFNLTHILNHKIGFTSKSHRIMTDLELGLRWDSHCFTIVLYLYSSVRPFARFANAWPLSSTQRPLASARSHRCRAHRRVRPERADPADSSELG